MSPDACRWLAVLLDLRSTDLDRKGAANNLIFYVSSLESRLNGSDRDELMRAAFAALKRPTLQLISND